MDLTALLQAAMQDPAARDFIGKMIGGGAPQPQADPRAMIGQTLRQAAMPAPAPAFRGAQQAVHDQLMQFNPMQMMQPPAPPQPPAGPAPGMGQPGPGMGQPGPGMPGPAPTNLLSMLMGRR